MMDRRRMILTCLGAAASAVVPTPVPAEESIFVRHTVTAKLLSYSRTPMVGPDGRRMVFISAVVEFPETHSVAEFRDTMNALSGNPPSGMVRKEATYSLDEERTLLSYSSVDAEV